MRDRTHFFYLEYVFLLLINLIYFFKIYNLFERKMFSDIKKVIRLIGGS